MRSVQSVLCEMLLLFAVRRIPAVAITLESANGVLVRGTGKEKGLRFNPGATGGDAVESDEDGDEVPAIPTLAAAAGQVMVEMEPLVTTGFTAQIVHDSLSSSADEVQVGDCVTHQPRASDHDEDDIQQQQVDFFDSQVGSIVLALSLRAPLLP